MPSFASATYFFPRRYPPRWATIIGELHVMTQATRHTDAAPPGNPKAALLEPGMVVRQRSPTYLVESVDTWTATSATGSMTVPTAILVSSTNVHTVSGYLLTRAIPTTVENYIEIGTINGANGQRSCSKSGC